MSMRQVILLSLMKKTKVHLRGLWFMFGSPTTQRNQTPKHTHRGSTPYVSPLNGWETPVSQTLPTGFDSPWGFLKKNPYFFKKYGFILVAPRGIEPRFNG